MKHLRLFILLLTITIFSSSCFEILEELHLNDNGTGQFSLTINMSESKVKLNSIMMLDSVQGYKVPKKYDIQRQMNLVKQRLSKIPGISEAQTTFDFNEYIGVIKFKFTNVSQINTAMKAIMDEYKAKDYSVPYYSYNKSTKTFNRSYTTQAKTITQYNKLKTDDKEVLRKAKYTHIYKFNKNITKSTNSAAKISKNKRALMQQSTLHGVISNGTKISQNITLE